MVGLTFQGSALLPFPEPRRSARSCALSNSEADKKSSLHCIRPEYMHKTCLQQHERDRAERRRAQHRIPALVRALQRQHCPRRSQPSPLVRDGKWGTHACPSPRRDGGGR